MKLKASDLSHCAAGEPAGWRNHAKIRHALHEEPEEDIDEIRGAVLYYASDRCSEHVTMPYLVFYECISTMFPSAQKKAECVPVNPTASSCISRHCCYWVQ